MLSIVVALVLVQAGGPSSADVPAKDELAPHAATVTDPGDDLRDDSEHTGTPGRSARLFAEPQVGTGALVGRVGMGLLFGGLAAAGMGAVDVALIFAGAGTPFLVGAAVVTAAVIGLATSLGAALFGRDYGRDFVDALIVAAVASVVGLVLFTIGFFAPAVLIPMLGLSMAIMVVGVPLVVQALKTPNGPEPTLALLRF
ncbi:MAG: hypothetical protein ACOZQL_26410 [Myxococcota bacterium]